VKSWISRPVPELPGTMPALRLYDTAAGGVVTLQADGEQSM
jgi:L-cysteine:1D-myo-inositol 2-amino-2-deoxy-alpha-D-glucopyranoside ligase